ncbi:uncharacterized protein [Littorina saxatilis]|uniref:uncharacterized protein isoform X2 n=1 Tax=Littorina saxatilis TaxID=31220 RepID=UPI0038B5D72C
MAKFSVREGTFSCCQILISSLLLTLTTFGSIPEQCARFTFPDNSPGTRVTIVEGSQINFPFKLDTSQCSDYSNKTIYVFVEQPDGTDFCAVRLKPEGCASTSKKNCACVDGNSADKGAMLTKIVTRDDKGAWVWRTGDGAARTTLMFAVQAAIAVPSTVKYAGTDHGPNIETTNNDVIFTSTFQAKLDDGKSRSSTHIPGDSIDGNDGIKSVKDGSTKDSNWMKVVTVVNFIVIVIVVVVVFLLCRIRRARKAHNGTCVNTPQPPGECGGHVVMFRKHHEANESGSNSYVSLCPIRHSDEELPAAFINDAYNVTFPRK